MEIENDIDLQIKKVELEKLEAERDQVKFKVSRAYKRNELVKGYSVIASTLAGLAAIGTLVWTIWQGVNQLGLQREERTDVRVEKAILELNSDDSKLRLYAVSSLRILLNNGASRRDIDILSAISYAIATEKEVLVRDSIISLLSSLNYEETSKSNLESTLGELVGLSRSLVLKEQLWTHHVRYFVKLRDETAESRAQSIAEAINIIINNNVRIDNLAGIYCAYCDFSGLDLEGTDFSESILSGADFTNSKLDNSAFDHAYLERASFINSSLKNSSFTDSRNFDKLVGSFVHQRLAYFDGSYAGPDFSCADLTNSNFSDFPIFILSSDEYDSVPYANKIPPKFIRTNLSGVDFSKAKVQIFRSDDLPEMDEYLLSSESGHGATNSLLWTAEFGENTVLSDKYYRNFSLSLMGIKAAFSGSSWKMARLPTGISLILADLESEDFMARIEIDVDDMRVIEELFNSPCLQIGLN